MEINSAKICLKGWLPPLCPINSSFEMTASTLNSNNQITLPCPLRFHTMSIMLAVELLGCTGSADERATLMQRFIYLASELKSNLANLFGFATVMKCLELPQVRRLMKAFVLNHEGKFINKELFFFNE